MHTRSFCTGHFVMIPLHLTYQHCLQHVFFEHLFNFNCNDIQHSNKHVKHITGTQDPFKQCIAYISNN